LQLPACLVLAIPVATLSSAFKLLPGRLPAGTAKFEFQRTVPLIAQGIVGATPTMRAFISIQACGYEWSILWQI
ncbi:MAG TPA: hypothetical protein VE715_22760, partial [Blastocatellia bacterium]|nr:hypothetical protein [Blastocatellia bacterium]